MASTNFTSFLDQIICKKMGYIRSFSIWENKYTFAPTVVLTLQLIVISLASRFVELWLRRLGQTSIVSQIIAGVLLGPSVLGQNRSAVRALFPPEGYMTLATVASLGNMFYHFLIATRTDTVMVLRPGRVAVFIGTTSFCTTMFFSVVMAMILRRYIEMDQAMHNGLVPIAMTQAFTGVSVVSYLITELKLQNTDVGRLSLAIAVFSDILNIFMVTLSFATSEKIRGHHVRLASAVLTTFGMAFLIFVVIRRVFLAMINYIPVGKPVDQKYIFSVVVTALILGFLSEVIGQHYVFGPAMLGLAVPEGPPLGAAVVARLETFVSGFLYPTYLAISGLQTNIFLINFKGILIVGFIVVFGMIIKTVAVIGAGMIVNIPPKDAFVLSMILCSKGILQITIYNFWKENKVLQREEFSLCVLSVVATTAVVTPLVRYLYDPTKQFQPIRINAIQHCKKDSDLRILVCIHHIENVPAVIKLLEISQASKQSPVAVTALVLVELVGRNVPILIPSDKEASQTNEKSAASRIVHALRVYEQQNDGCTRIQSFTSISSFDMMHLDIIRMAMQRAANILILPFHKKWSIDEMVESTTASIRRLNVNVLEKAPCSVGILIDRGVMNAPSNVVSCMMKFNVAVIFLGGPDDAESLAYGARMVRHRSVILTVIRFLIFGSENSIERKRDSELIFQYKQANAGNERFLYVEEVVRDGVGLSECIGKLVNYFDLILVGRFHQESSIFNGLEAWSECLELGVVGDMLASPDLKTTASVLVVQQQRIRANRRKSRPLVVSQDNSFSSDEK